MKLARIALFLLTMLLFNRVYGVGFDKTEYELVKQDIHSLLSAQSTEAYRVLTIESQGPEIRLGTEQGNQGEIIATLPIKKDGLIVLQIPHAFFDLHTKEIAEFWVETGNIDILMINTEQRYTTDRSDLSRISRSLFTAMADVLIAQDINARVIQLHGYSEGRRSTQSGAHADIILSNGLPVSTSDIVKMQSCLRDNMNLLARAYGRDVFELGATINPIGRLINRNDGHQVSFLHVEMSRATREQFLNPETAKAASSCIL